MCPALDPASSRVITIDKGPQQRQNPGMKKPPERAVLARFFYCYYDLSSPVGLAIGETGGRRSASAPPLFLGVLPACAAPTIRLLLVLSTVLDPASSAGRRGWRGPMACGSPRILWALAMAE